MITHAFGIASATAVVGALLCIVSAFKFNAKRYLRIFEAVCLIYLAGVYAAACNGIWREVYLLKSGFLPVIGIIFLTLLFVVEIIADWGREE